MNTPSPLIPQGSLQGMPKGNSNIRIAVFTIIAIHAVFFGGLLMQGCKRDKDTAKANPTQQTNSLPPLTNTESNYYNAITQAVQNTETPPLPANTNTSTAANNTSPSNIATASETAAKAPTATKEYTIASHDTYSSIARKFGTTIEALKQANPGVDPAHLKVKQKIQIPVPETTAASGSAPASSGGTNVTEMSANANGGTLHVVKPGETLSKISKHYGVSVKAIRAANHLKSDRIAVNQKLKIPAPAHAAAHSDTSTQ